MIFVWFLSVVIYFLALGRGYIEFHLWSQIYDFVANVATAQGISWEMVKHVHFFRFLVVFPSLYFSVIFQKMPDAIFTYQVGIMITLLPFFLYFYRPLAQRLPYKWSFISFFFITYALLSLTMNGRIASAHLGFAIALSALHQWDQQRIGRMGFFSLYFVSVFLCSVSTGTIFIPLFLLAVYFATNFIRNIKARGLSRFDIYALVAFTFIILFLSPYFYGLLDKNLSFYGGSFISMMEHGLGQVFIRLLIFLPLILVALFVFFGFFIFLAIRYKFNPLIVMAMCVTACGGMFGFSTLSLIFLPLLLLAYENLEKAVATYLAKTTFRH